MTRLLALTFVALAVVGCASAKVQEPQVPKQVRQLSATEKTALKKSLASDMKDPDATQFRWMPLAFDDSNPTADYCALLNGKNSYGGYTGFRTFRAILKRNAKNEYDSGTIIQI